MSPLTLSPHAQQCLNAARTALTTAQRHRQAYDSALATGGPYLCQECGRGHHDADPLCVTCAHDLWQQIRRRRDAEARLTPLRTDDTADRR